MNAGTTESALAAHEEPTPALAASTDDSRTISIEGGADGVFVLRVDEPGRRVNTLNGRFAAELQERLTELSHEPALRALVLISGKPDSFVAGADIDVLRAVESREEAFALSQTGQRALAALSAFPAPVVAAIHGACLGGGLELALACSERIATDHGKTQLGFPEVRLGLVPGLGGTQRLPRLIGVKSALELLLGGKSVDAERAQTLRLVDAVVPAAVLLESAIERASRRSRGTAARSALAIAHADRPRTFLRRMFEKTEAVLADNGLGRSLVFEQAKRRLPSELWGRNPALERISNVVRIGLDEGLPRGMQAESEAFAELAVSFEARALMHLFAATRNTKLTSDAAGPDVSRVAVLGAGATGIGFAFASAARAGVEVRLKDQSDSALSAGLRGLHEQLDERVRSARSSAVDRERALALVTTTTTYVGFRGVDLVFEAGPEDLSAKQARLSEVEEASRKSTIFAANTWCFSASAIAERALRPERVACLRYGLPMAEPRLLEVVRSASASVRETCVALGERQGKTVVVVGDGPGGFTFRVLARYLCEALFLVADGAPLEQVDLALVDWGFASGPLATIDELGLERASKLVGVLQQAFPERFPAPPLLRTLLDARRLGRKNRRGFYRYEDAAAGPRFADPDVAALLGAKASPFCSGTELARRCVFALLNEGAYCLAEGVIGGPCDGDVAAVLGFGFPAFRGGPFHHVDVMGVAELLRVLQSYEHEFGTRYRPAPQLVEMGRTGARFHDASFVAREQHRD